MQAGETTLGSPNTLLPRLQRRRRLRDVGGLMGVFEALMCGVWLKIVARASGCVADGMPARRSAVNVEVASTKGGLVEYYGWDFWQSCIQLLSDRVCNQHPGGGCASVSARTCREKRQGSLKLREEGCEATGAAGEKWAQQLGKPPTPHLDRRGRTPRRSDAC